MQIISFDIGGTTVKYGFVNENYQFEFLGNFLTNKKTLFEDLISVLDKYQTKFDAIAISTTGVVSSKLKKIVHTNSDYEELMSLDFNKLENLYNKKLVLINDANAAALAELIHAKEIIKNYAVITFGTGVGAGVVLNCKLFESENGLGGELGYLGFQNSNINEVLSFTNLNKKLKKEFYCDSHDKDAFVLNYKNNKKFKEIILNYLKNIAQFLANSAIFLNLDLIKYGGGLAHLDKQFREILENEFYQILSKTPFKTKIASAKYKNNSGILGAAYLIFNDSIYD
ncbi:ROK family protein [Mycoplasmopsis cricetuli]|uniref:ROK family protein n=1 Tax=Mycoplasmopsis cricetuli TaxID=171283 RepID=UPI000470C8DF|nr:ROK family protein [Mycoplasmopsis cricetuli]